MVESTSRADVDFLASESIKDCVYALRHVVMMKMMKSEIASMVHEMLSTSKKGLIDQYIALRTQIGGDKNGPGTGWKAGSGGGKTTKEAKCGCVCSGSNDGFLSTKRAAAEVTQDGAKIEEIIHESIDELTLLHIKGTWGQFWCQPWHYFRKRFSRSNVRKFYYGLAVQVSEADTAVNTLTLVNALLVTVPFTIMSVLNNTFWDWLFDTLTNQCHDDDGEAYHYYYHNTILRLYAAIYASFIALIMSCFNYLLRPSDDADFPRWWKRGKWVLLCIFFGGFVAVISIINLLSSTAATLVNSTHNLCHIYPLDGRYGDIYSTSTEIGSLITAVVCVVCIALML